MGHFALELRRVRRQRRITRTNCAGSYSLRRVCVLNDEVSQDLELNLELSMIAIRKMSFKMPPAKSKVLRKLQMPNRKLSLLAMSQSVKP
jgi:hypothetical protein